MTIIEYEYAAATVRALMAAETAMARKRYRPEEIVAKLRQVDVLDWCPHPCTAWRLIESSLWKDLEYQQTIPFAR